MPYDIEIEEWHEQQIEEEDLDYDIENPKEDEPINQIGRI